MRSPGLLSACFVLLLSTLTRTINQTNLHMCCRHIDCAWTYGNQPEVGAAFDQIFKTEGKIKRSDVFVTTKLWNHHHKDVRGDCLDSLKQLRLEYLDLYLMHWPAQGPGYEGKTNVPSIKVPTAKSMLGLIGLDSCLGYRFAFIFLLHP